jgi:hypothetical protein
MHANIGGNNQMSISQETCLNDSKSYDESYQFSASLLKFQWSCVVISLLWYGDSCEEIFSNVSQSASSRLLLISEMSLNAKYLISVLVMSNDNKRSDTALVIVTRANTTSGSAYSTIAMAPSIINYNDNLLLSGFIQSNLSNVFAVWSAQQDDISVSLSHYLLQSRQSLLISAAIIYYKA